MASQTPQGIALPEAEKLPEGHFPEAFTLDKILKLVPEEIREAYASIYECSSVVVDSAEQTTPHAMAPLVHRMGDVYPGLVDLLNEYGGGFVGNSMLLSIFNTGKGPVVVVAKAGAFENAIVLMQTARAEGGLGDVMISKWNGGSWDGVDLGIQDLLTLRVLDHAGALVLRRVVVGPWRVKFKERGTSYDEPELWTLDFDVEVHDFFLPKLTS